MGKLHNFNIVQDNKMKSKVIIDGMELKGVTRVEYSNSSSFQPVITLEIVVGTLNIELEEK